jgi:Gpi18-like mannosyltransferase
MRHHKLVIFFLFLLAFLLRAEASVWVNKGDILVIEEWSRSLYEKGTSGSYFREGWVYSMPTQPPLMMLLYWTSRYFYQQRYLLSQWHNLIRIPPTFVILWVDKNGPLFIVRLWGIIADLFSAVTVYLVVNKLKDKKKAFWAMNFILFNPILIFESSIWGQVDLLSPLLALVAFFFLFSKNKWGRIVSPIIFTLGVFIKPTILVLAPLYLLFVVKIFLLSSQKKKEELLSIFLGVVLSLGLILLFFLPFWDKSEPLLKYVNNVVTRRILPSAKGVSKVATSGFTFFTVFYQIDKTPGSRKLLFLTLDQIGNFFFLLINVWAAVLILGKKQSNFPKITKILFLGYFVAEGTYIFKTGMAERYFFPAFLFLYLLLFLINKSNLRKAFYLQMGIWFINLIVSFFLRDYAWLDLIFRQNNYWGTRFISLINVLVYLYIVKSLIKLNYQTKG